VFAFHKPSGEIRAKKFNGGKRKNGNDSSGIVLPTALMLGARGESIWEEVVLETGVGTLGMEGKIRKRGTAATYWLISNACTGKRWERGSNGEKGA